MPVAPIASTELKPIAPIVVEPPNETIQAIENPIEKRLKNSLKMNPNRRF